MICGNAECDCRMHSECFSKGDTPDDFASQQATAEAEALVIAREGRIAKLEQQLRQARESNKVLHRRCQRQESALAEVAKGSKGGPSLGRALANATAETLQARVKELEAELDNSISFCRSRERELGGVIADQDREIERLREIVNWPAQRKAILEQADQTPCSNCGDMPYRRHGNITHGCPGESPRCYSSEGWIKENTP
jgi:chromosome segregation ATPase